MKYKGVNCYVDYIHHNRMNNIIASAFILANRYKISKAVAEGYRNLLAPSEVVSNFYERSLNGMIDLCFTEMGLDITCEDINNECITDFSVDINTLDKHLLTEVNKCYNRINKHSLVLFWKQHPVELIGVIWFATNNGNQQFKTLKTMNANEQVQSGLLQLQLSLDMLHYLTINS